MSEEYVYDANVKHSDKSSKKYLLICHLFKTITSLFVSTFLTAHIYTFSSDAFGYLFNVAVFYISVYLSMMVFYMILSIFVDKTNRVIFYRISIVVTGILIIIIISFGEQLAQLLILAGALHGLSEALYYSSYNVIKEEMVGKSSMGKFITSSRAIGDLLNIICPVTLGALIDITTYSQTALIVFVVCSIQFGLTFGIKSKRPQNSHYDLFAYKRKLKDSPIKKQIGLVYTMAYIYGITSLTSTLINVYIMLQFGTNMSLGIVSSILSVVSIISLLLLMKFTKPTNRKPIFIIFASLIVVASILFVFLPSKVTLIALNSIIAITSVLHIDLLEKYRFSILKSAGLYDEIAEHQTVYENRLNIARIVSFGLLLLVSLFKSEVAINTFVLIALISVSSVQIMLLFYEKKYVIPEEQTTTESVSVTNEPTKEEK